MPAHQLLDDLVVFINGIDCRLGKCHEEGKPRLLPNWLETSAPGEDVH